MHQDPQTVYDADWSYAMASGSITLLSTSPAEQNDSRGVHRYPTRSHRRPQRLTEQTDLQHNVCNGLLGSYSFLKGKECRVL